MEKITKVTVYSTPVCPYCDMLKDFLRTRNIKFEEEDVSRDKAKAQEMIKKSKQLGVPVMILKRGKKEEVVIGFNREKLRSIFGI